jgi:hypothetical protein
VRPRVFIIRAYEHELNVPERCRRGPVRQGTLRNKTKNSFPTNLQSTVLCFLSKDAEANEGRKNWSDQTLFESLNV